MSPGVGSFYQEVAFLREVSERAVGADRREGKRGKEEVKSAE